MNKRSLIAYALGGALGAGCTTTYTQSDLYDLIASDRKIDASDYRTFLNAEQSLVQRIASQEGEEKTRSEAILADVRKIITKYQDMSNKDARIKLQPVFDFYMPSGEERNLNGNEDSDSYLELTLDELTKKIGDARVVFDILSKATPTWESTQGKKSNAKRMVYRTSVDNLRKWFGAYAIHGDSVVEIMTNVSPDNRFTVVPGTAGVRAIVNYGVDVTDADLESLKNLRPAEPVEEEQPEEKPESK